MPPAGQRDYETLLRYPSIVKGSIMRYTVSDVRQSFSGPKREKEFQVNLLGYILYRQVSFLLTPLFLNLSISANTVSLVNLVIVVSIPMLAIVGGQFAFAYVAAGCFLFHCLDYVDGNIARVRKATSDLGQYLDAFGGNLFWILLFPSIGIMVDRSAPRVLSSEGAGLFLGMCASLFDIFAKESRTAAKLCFGAGSSHFSPQRLAKTGPLRSFSAALPGLIYLYLPLLLVSGTTHTLYIPLAFVLGFTGGVFLYTQARVFRLLLGERRNEGRG